MFTNDKIDCFRKVQLLKRNNRLFQKICILLVNIIFLNFHYLRGLNIQLILLQKRCVTLKAFFLQIFNEYSFKCSTA